MAKETGKSAPLNRARVLAAAVELADEVGLDALSMRSLSGRLGVVPMALYKHVADKEDLVSGMIDAVVAGFPPPPADLGWSESVRFRIAAARTCLDEHAWLRDGLQQSTRRTPAVLSHMNSIAGDLARAGFAYDLIHYGMHALGYRIWGFNPEAFSPPPGAPPEPEPSSEELAALAGAYPHIAAVAADAATRNPTGACEERAEFDFGLDLLLEAFERLHASGWVSR
jgi:AcrR family transcriptional regulator